MHYAYPASFIRESDLVMAAWKRDPIDSHRIELFLIANERKREWESERKAPITSLDDVTAGKTAHRLPRARNIRYTRMLRRTYCNYTWLHARERF